MLGDYISGPYDVIFISGRTNYMLNITINDDDLLEAVESFNLTIGSLTGDATIGNLDHTMISIFDNDGESIQDLYLCMTITTMVCDFLQKSQYNLPNNYTLLQKKLE